MIDEMFWGDMLYLLLIMWTLIGLLFWLYGGDGNFRKIYLIVIWPVIFVIALGFKIYNDIFANEHD